MGRNCVRLAIAFVIVLAFGCGSSHRATGDSGTGSGVQNDAPVQGNGQFGDPCNVHTDCAGGYCVEPTPGSGGQCSRQCNNDCPSGWDCVAVSFPDGPVSLCVPNTARQCLSCVADTECPGGGCLTIDGGGRCAATCTGAGQCPAGYACAPDATGAHTGMFCQPTNGSCTCNASMQGASRACSNANSFGTCYGTQMCDAANGWSVCTAKVPATETCNGIDDNCNFVIDDGVGGGEPCSITNGFGTCTGVRTCEGTSGFQCHGQTPMAELCNGIDDNCNGTVDEGFPGLGNACTAGVGACLRYGAVTCNSMGNGTQCGAVAGTPTTETCNHLDDDCDGMVDEDYPNLGVQCSAGMGICQRFGTYVCSGGASVCSATPGTGTTETCNYLDDNCDGIVDNGYLDPGNGLYDTNANCGACGNDCTTQFTTFHSFGACAVVGTAAQCVMKCTAGAFDLDGATADGCEFLLDATAIYVSANDTGAADDSTCGLGPAGTGAGNHACKTIAYGSTRAAATGRTRIDVANATYNESVTLLNGISLYGGYAANTWGRDLANTSTAIQGVSTVGNHDRTIVAINITSATVFEGFVVRGSDNAKASGNSYAFYISGSNGNLAIRSNQIVAGRGGPGTTGNAGTNGMAGTNGAAYSPAQYDSFTVTGTGQCNASNNRAAYGAGAHACGGDIVDGGNGGGNNCTPSRSTQNSTSASPATAGQPGAGGAAGGTAGTRGYDADLQGNTCFVPVSGSNVLPMFGTNGGRGGDGGNAAGGVGCSIAAGSVVLGNWIANGGNSGLVGQNGGGGGGGGAGGGAACTTNGTCKDMLGGHGGGGAGAGCGGTGGGGGTAGGGVFGIFVTGGTAPTITGNTITLGGGGAGGTGGIGGAGGLGGTGAGGGQIGALFCTGKGGRGGDGGNGGAGSGGGGGCGGSSFGIFTSGVGTPAYCSNNTLSGGNAGAAGAGGFSGGNSGGAGLAGTVSACTSI